MELLLIKEDGTEWISMWENVATHPVNEGLENPKEALNEGEVWQYMGSIKVKHKIIHHLRHRKHPVTQNLYSLVFYASDNFSEDDINIEKKIK